MKAAMKYIFLLSFMIFSVLTASAGNSESITVGVRKDAAPFSYELKDINLTRGSFKSYGGYLVDICMGVLDHLLLEKRYEGLKIEVVEVSAENRFDLLDDRTIDVLCSPDSITHERTKKYLVSHPVFLTGVSYVYNIEYFPVGDDIPCKNTLAIVGVLKNTTSYEKALKILGEGGDFFRYSDSVLNYLKSKQKSELDLDVKHSKSRPPIGCNSGSTEIIFADSHTSLSKMFCAGEILFYVGDIDIIRASVRKNNKCTGTIVNYTATREYYGIHFRFPERLSELNSRDFDDLYLYSIFNNTLLRLMQSEEGILEKSLRTEFPGAHISTDLVAFFKALKFVRQD